MRVYKNFFFQIFSVSIFRHILWRGYKMVLPILDSQLVLLHFWISSAKVGKNYIASLSLSLSLSIYIYIYVHYLKLPFSWLPLTILHVDLQVNVITLLNTFTFGFKLLQIISSLPLNGTKPASAGWFWCIYYCCVLSSIAWYLGRRASSAA